MLDAMRKSARSLGMKFVLMLIVLTFVFMGAGSFLSRGPEEVGTVNGETITIKEFQRTYSDIVENFRRQYGDNVDEAFLKSINIEQYALNSLIDKKLLLQVAAEKSLDVPNEALIDAIARIPAFQTDGRFDREKYNLLLQQNRLSPQQFEAAQKESILARQIQNFIANAVAVSESEARAWFEWANTEINVDYVAFQPSDFQDIDIAEADTRAYYENNKEKYRIPARAKARYVRFNPEKFISGATVSDEEIAAYYARNESKYETGETTLPLESVEDDIRETLARQKAGDIAYERAMEMYDISFGGDDLLENADRFGYTVETTGFFTRSEGPGDIDNSESFAEAAFELPLEQISEPLEINDAYYLLQPIDKKEAEIPDFEDVKADVKKDVKKEHRITAAKTAAADFLDKTAESGSFADAAQNADRVIASTGFFTRQETVPGIGQAPEFKKAAFEIGKINDIYDSVINVSGKFLIIRLAGQKVPPESEFMEKKDQVLARLAARKQQETFENWMASLRKNSDIEISDRFSQQIN